MGNDTCSIDLLHCAPSSILCCSKNKENGKWERRQHISHMSVSRKALPTLYIVQCNLNDLVIYIASALCYKMYSKQFVIYVCVCVCIYSLDIIEAFIEQCM